MERLIRIILRDKGVLLLPLMVGVLGVSFFPILMGSKDLVENKKEIILAVAALGAFMAILMTQFLSGSTSSRVLDREKAELNYLHHKLRELTKQKSLLSQEDSEKLIASVKNQIDSSATDEYINELKKKVSETEFYFHISQRGKSTLDRIYSEIDALGRRGTVNLVLGVITALSGVLTLSFFVLANESTHQSISEFTMSFLPRLSIVLIIEVFSYFFLRLYKSSLSEIKYFQNEATNIEHNFVALEASIKMEDKILIEKCINKFLEVERNPIILEKQTTREILSEQVESKSMSLSPDYLIKIIEAMKEKKS